MPFENLPNDTILRSLRFAGGECPKPNLKNASVTCKRLAILCRPLMFSHTAIRVEESEADDPLGPHVHFASSHPHVTIHIQELTILGRLEWTEDRGWAEPLRLSTGTIQRLCNPGTMPRLVTLTVASGIWDETDDEELTPLTQLQTLRLTDLYPLSMSAAPFTLLPTMPSLKSLAVHMSNDYFPSPEQINFLTTTPSPIARLEI